MKKRKREVSWRKHRWEGGIARRHSEKKWNEAQQKQRTKKILHHQTNTITICRHKNNTATINGDAEQRYIAQRRKKNHAPVITRASNENNKPFWQRKKVKERGKKRTWKGYKYIILYFYMLLYNSVCTQYCTTKHIYIKL